MLNTTTSKASNIDVSKAIQRMESHACKSRASFAEALKVQAPRSTYGILAGPAKTKKRD